MDGLVWDSEKSEMELRLMNRIADTSPTFVCTRKTLSERDDERDEPESDTQLIGHGMKFASPTKTMPNVEVSNCHASLVVLNVSMVQPTLVGHGTRMQRGQQPTLRERVVTDRLGRMQRERRHSTTITVTNRQRIPHPYQLNHTPLSPPRRLLVPFERFDEPIEDSSNLGSLPYYRRFRQHRKDTHNPAHNHHPSPPTPCGTGMSLSARGQREMSRFAADLGSEVERWVGEVGREAERAEGMVAQKREQLAMHYS
ncbi:hypothetical protein BLNAU_22813 [Blattamonas nauphoetae]|uniref:Uncharacterized protein n=1 Tax=Blattamonas nauphoetae TaxID=2049346 RepID=A0ABQ9WS27_9EUKA|nr:hypothetical protein BLNAU_22813 [Blattamonas nauphoetae]